MGRLPSQLRASLLRPVLRQRHPLPSPGAASPRPWCLASTAAAAAAAATVETRTRALHSSSFFLFSASRRSFCSTSTTANVDAPSSAGSPHLVVVESAEDFNNALKKVQEGALPAIFYFSAAWCAPCKFLAPVVNELSKMYPPCVTYKIDIDMEGIERKLSELGISAVPTLKFYKDGKMAATVTGADVKKIKEIMDEFYK